MNTRYAVNFEAENEKKARVISAMRDILTDVAQWMDETKMLGRVAHPVYADKLRKRIAIALSQ